MAVASSDLNGMSFPAPGVAEPYACYDTHPRREPVRYNDTATRRYHASPAQRFRYARPVQSVAAYILRALPAGRTDTPVAGRILSSAETPTARTFRRLPPSR